MSTSSARPLLGEIHHQGYIVADLQTAAETLAHQTGAGPFLRIDHVPLDSTEHHGGPAVFDHSSAFGLSGSTFIELMQMHELSPGPVALAFDCDQTPRLHHFAWVVPDLETAVDALSKDGLSAYLRASLGDIRFAYHNARSVLGPDVELHQDGPALRGFFDTIRQASMEWDGSAPIRPMQG